MPSNTCGYIIVYAGGKSIRSLYRLRAGVLTQLHGGQWGEWANVTDMGAFHVTTRIEDVASKLQRSHENMSYPHDPGIRVSVVISPLLVLNRLRDQFVLKVAFAKLL